MGLTFKGDLKIRPGGEQKLPIITDGASVLTLDFSIEEALEVDFSLTFTPEEGGDIQILAPVECLSTKQSTITVDAAGICTLVWNNCYVGMFGGKSRKVAYSAMLHSQRETKEEEERKAREEEEERRRLAEKAAVEDRKRLEEQESLRREARGRRMLQLRDEAEDARGAAAEKREKLNAMQAELSRMREEILEIEQKVSDEKTAMEDWEADAQKAAREADRLCRERDTEPLLSDAVLPHGTKVEQDPGSPIHALSLSNSTLPHSTEVEEIS